MSWFNINDSLNTIKGQISNVTSVVQEAFNEGIVEDADPFKKLEEATKRIDDLTNLCSTQDNEIINLRRQILEFQQAKNVEGTGPSKSTNEQNASTTSATSTTLEDSWFWDSEQTTGSSASSHNNEVTSSKSGSGGDLTIIPLDNSDQATEKLRRIIDERDQQLKQIKIENAVLNQKVEQLSAENRSINENIELLDRDHDAAIMEIITLKKSVEGKYVAVEKELKLVKEKNHSLEELLSKHEELKLTVDTVEQSLVAARQQNEALKADIGNIQDELKKKCDENLELLAAHDQKEKELLEKFEYVEVNKEKTCIQEGLKEDIATLTERLQQLDSINTDYEALKVKFDSLVAEKEKLNEEHTQFQIETKASDLYFREEIRNLQNEHTANDAAVVAERERNQIHEENYASIQASFLELKGKYERLLDSDESASPKSREEFEAFKAEASECESRLVQENVILQKQIIDLQSSLNNKKSEGSGDSVTIDELGAMFKKHVNITINKSNLVEVLKCLGDSLSALDKNSQDLDDLTDKLYDLTKEKKRIEHDKETLQADLRHYEVEVAELMKNNELLILEIDNLKNGKLETISEHNEDSIVILEKQLEDCSNLNQSLEDEYNEIRDKLKRVNEERDLANSKIKELEESVQHHQIKLKETVLQIDSIENEKSNLQFELNELKVDDHKSVLDAECKRLKDEILSLEAKIIVLTSEQDETMEKSKLKKLKSAQATAELENIIKEQKQQLNEMEQLIAKKSTDIKELLEEVRIVKTSGEDALQNLLESEKEKIEHELIEVKSLLEAKQSEFCVVTDNLQREISNNENNLTKISDLSQLIEELQSTEMTNNSAIFNEKEQLTQSMDTLVKEKNDLIAMVMAKHDENVKYHSEIQRLGAILTEELNRSRDCDQCKLLQQRLDEGAAGTMEREEKLNDQVTFLREKADILQQNLLTEQNNQKMLNQERLELIDDKANLRKDLDRLREHLLEIEEAHTQETVELQKTIQTTKLKMSTVEEDAKKSSNAYTSASIRANQHNETLQAQYMLLIQQRDEYSAKLSAAEDKESRSEAALINLQCALEQFQKNKDRDIEAITQKLRRDLDAEVTQHGKLLSEIKELKGQLNESKNGLLAAARISDQLENYQLANTNLKDELRLALEKCAINEQKLNETIASYADKVDKGLVKNLMIGYVVAPNNNDKLQILKLISAVLEFSQNEIEKVGLNRSHGGWLDSIRSAATGAAGNDNYNKEGLAQAFVKFLEKESQPRSTNAAATSALLSMVHQQQPSNRSSPSSGNDHIPINYSVPPTNNVLLSSASLTSTTTAASSSTAFDTSSTPVPVIAAVQPIVLTEGLMQNFAPPRNSSSILKDILNDS